ncbi:uncharacterized protein FIBRA_02719 [Fibroporia radiculosa]|uniref:Uncharacterized protein n=1 Tax=Fibroporia radiculosa TaxID=599839 RepID=J4GN23_9APHY|nr:uncharacterized protein FIBRA_02719 [Fibroporia radiculosa]CCM00680.1 predicted protein [Fibroporia radiculosa]
MSFDSGSTTTTVDPHAQLPALPIELMMQIFEVAASQSLTSAKSLSLVASWSRKLTLPYLFTTIVHRVGNVRILAMAGAGYQINKPRTRLPEHIGRVVRNLWTESVGVSSPTNGMDLFQTCPNIEHMALPSAALRALYMSCQVASKRTPVDLARPAFPSVLRHITLITHTMRYEWHFLAGLRTPDGNLFLHNIAYLHMLDMQISTYVPHEMLPNLTHLALPYLDLGGNIAHDLLRLPDGVLEHPSLQMLVLTIDEFKYLNNPWYHIDRYAAPAPGATRYIPPRDSFRRIVRHARQRDERIHVILHPNSSQKALQEWKLAADGGQSIWQKAVLARKDETYGTHLPTAYDSNPRT